MGREGVIKEIVELVEQGRLSDLSDSKLMVLYDMLKNDTKPNSPKSMLTQRLYLMLGNPVLPKREL